MTKSVIESFRLEVPLGLSICPMPAQLIAGRNADLNGRYVVFHPRSVKTAGERKSRIDLLARTGGEINYAGWNHAQLLLDKEQDIPAQYRDKLLLFPGTFLLDEGSNIYVPSMFRQGNRWGRSYVLLQGAFPLWSEVLMLEVEAFE